MKYQRITTIFDNMKKVTFSLLFLLYVSSAYTQELGFPFSKYFSSKEYNGGIQNYAISQDQNGIMYVANNFGLLEYDGTRWNRYPIPNSTKIRDLFIETNGRIFIAAQGQLGYFRPNKQGFFEFISWTPRLPLQYQNIEEVWKIYKISNLYVFCSFKAIFIFDQSGNLEKTLEPIGVFNSFHVSNNQFYFQDTEVGLMRLEQQEAVQLTQTEILRQDLVSGVLEKTPGELMIFTEKGDVFLNTQLGTKKWQPYEMPNLNKVNVVLRLRNGNIAIGTQYDGLYILKENGLLEMHMNLQRGLNNNTIISLFEDKAGNIWLGHNNGISLLEISLPFRILGPDSGIFGTGYAAKQVGEDIYLATNVQVSKISGPDHAVSKVINAEGQSYSFHNIENGLLLAHNEGAFVIYNNLASRLDGINGLWTYITLKQNPNLLLAGTYNGLALFEKQGENYKFLRILKGFDESARLIQQDEQGHIWVSHGYKGIFKIQLSEDLTEVNVRFFNNKDGLPTNLLNSVWKIGGRIIFTTEYGIYVYNPETDRFEKDQLINPYFEHDFLITSLVEDPVGNIYYIGLYEAGVLEKQMDGTYIKIKELFNKIIPFLNDDLQNVSLLKSNEVLYAANEGFIWYKKDINKSIPAAFPTFIRAVYLTKPTDSLLFLGKNTTRMEENFGTDEGLVLAYNQADIRFEYTNTIPNNENTTQFRFKLEGLEDEFSEWTSKRDKAYTNLREGKYTFHVQSKDIYEQLVEANTFSFTVLPPWYRSNAAWFIYLLCFIGFGAITFNRVDKLYQKKTKAITAKQRKELEEKSTDLAQSKRELEKLKTEKLETEIQGKNKELASATMHLLNKNGFIDQTKNQLTQIIKKSQSEEVKNELQKVINSISKNIAEDKDWEQFEIHFDQVHGDFMNRFKKAYPTISPQEIKLSAYLRMNLSTKEIAYLMNISTRGVEISRYRLRKKLNLERSDNLQEFILKF